MLISTEHFFVWTDISMLGHFKAICGRVSPYCTKLGFFYRHRYTSDGIIATFEFIYVNNKFSLLPPTNSCTFSLLGATGRHWAPLSATSHKMDSHRWSLLLPLLSPSPLPRWRSEHPTLHSIDLSQNTGIGARPLIMV
jgi:hypothetical protein